MRPCFPGHAGRAGGVGRELPSICPSVRHPGDKPHRRHVRPSPAGCSQGSCRAVAAGSPLRACWHVPDAPAARTVCRPHSAGSPSCSLALLWLFPATSHQSLTDDNRPLSPALRHPRPPALSQRPLPGSGLTRRSPSGEVKGTLETRSIEGSRPGDNARQGAHALSLVPPARAPGPANGGLGRSGGPRAANWSALWS